MGDVHEHLVEELVDTMMYLLEVMQCYNITPKEFTNGFAKKHNYNMGRDFASENKWV
jgi:hypothetical protein